MDEIKNLVNVESLKKFWKLYWARKKLDGKAKEINKTLERMNPELVKHLEEIEANTELDLSVVSLAGGMSFKKDTTIWAAFPKGKEAAAKVLKECGFQDLVKVDWFDSNSVSSLLRELDAKREIPPEFKGVIEKNPSTKITPKKF